MSAAIELVLQLANENNRRISLGNDWVPSSTLLDVMQHPSMVEFWERNKTNANSTLRYLQTSIPECDWSQTTLKKLLKTSTNSKSTTTRALLILQMPTRTAATTEEANSNEQQHQHQQQDADIQKAIDTLLKHNFDADTKICILTLLKMIENVIQQPMNPKVRSIRLSNKTFHSKVGCRPGGVDILLACGFVRQTPSTGLLSSATTPNDETTTMLVLPSEHESTSILVCARSMLVQCALQTLHMTADELPKQKPPPPPIALTQSSSGGGSSGKATSSKSTTSFDPYKAQRHDGVSSATGIKVTPDETYVSTTEKQLQQYKNKQAKLEQSHLSKPFERHLIAGLPGSSDTLAAAAAESDTTSSQQQQPRGDGSLLAQQYQKRQQERLAREEGGFTTKAMRDLEKMKTTKVYKFVSLKIQFADGSFIQGKFRPKERISHIVQVLQDECLLLGSKVEFDLYVAPPRRKLVLNKTLVEEGLVPAAKIFLSWKMESAPVQGTPVGSFLKPELFPKQKGQEQQVDEFPNGIPLVGGGSTSKKGATSKNKNDSKSSATTAEEREEEMMRRMMGGGKGKGSLLGGGGGATKKKSSNKPKWFKG